jgi:hypothetical protein
VWRGRAEGRERPTGRRRGIVENVRKQHVFGVPDMKKAFCRLSDKPGKNETT